MKMKLQTDGEGYIYFNQCLFSFFKQVFLQGITANLTQEGLKIINREERMSKIVMEQKKKQLIVASLGYKSFQNSETVNASSDLLQKAPTANPMVTLIFSGMCFKTWKSFTKHAQDFLDENSIPSFKSQSQDDFEDDFGELEIDSRNTLSKKASSRMISKNPSQQFLNVDGISNSLKQIKIQGGLAFSNVRPNSGNSNIKDSDDHSERSKGHQKLKSDIPINSNILKNRPGQIE